MQTKENLSPNTIIVQAGLFAVGVVSAIALLSIF